MADFAKALLSADRILVAGGSMKTPVERYFSNSTAKALVAYEKVADLVDDKIPRLFCSALRHAVLGSMLLSAGCGGGGGGSITPPSDTTPAVISNGRPTGALPGGPSGAAQATLQVDTNENATCKYGTTANTPYASMPNTFSTTGTRNHSAQITNLTNGQTFSYFVRCQDAAGNQNSSDFGITFSVNDLAPTITPGSFGFSVPNQSQPRTVRFGWNITGNNATCEVDPTNDGTFDYVIPGCTSASTQDHTYQSDGQFVAKLRVRNSGGEVTDTVNVGVSTPTIISIDGVVTDEITDQCEDTVRGLTVRLIYISNNNQAFTTNTDNSCGYTFPNIQLVPGPNNGNFEIQVLRGESNPKNNSVYTYKEPFVTTTNITLPPLEMIRFGVDPDNSTDADPRKDRLTWIKWMTGTSNGESYDVVIPPVTGQPYTILRTWRDQDVRPQNYNPTNPPTPEGIGVFAVSPPGVPVDHSAALDAAIADLNAAIGRSVFRRVTSEPATGVRFVYDTNFSIAGNTIEEVFAVDSNNKPHSSYKI